MTGSPFDRAWSSIPVTVVTHGPLPSRPDGTALLHLDPALHEHTPGSECLACAAAGDVRAMLFDLLTQSRQDKQQLDGVVIDASHLADPSTVIAKLDRATPAIGLRDHTVLRSFHLREVI
jgi:G3E family GTPase